VNVTSLTNDILSGFGAWAISNADDDLKDIDDASGDLLYIQLRQKTSNTHYYIRLIQIDGGADSELDASGAIAVNTESFLSITRSTLTTITIQVYSTAALRIAGGAGDVKTLSGTCINTAFRYVYGVASYNTGDTGKDISGTVSNLNIHPKTGRVLFYNEG